MEAARPDNCIIHCRVSSAKQAKERDSLEAQEAIGRSLAKRRGWNVLRVFREPYSGRKRERPMVEEVLAFIGDRRRSVGYYIFRGIDRLTRAGVVEYETLKSRIEAQGVTVVDTYGLIQPRQNSLEHLGFEYDWSVYSPSEAAEMLEAHRSRQEVRDILTRMIGAEIKLTQEGFKVRQAADGFFNKRIDIDGKKRVIEVPDPERAPFFREMFRLRATTTLPDEEIVRCINAMGYRSKRRRRWNHCRDGIIGYSTPRPLTVKQLQRIIKRPIYCGVRLEKWTSGKPVKTQYPGLVSIETFNRANRGKLHIEKLPCGELRLASCSPSAKRQRDNPLYPYRHVVVCPGCRMPFLGSASRGKKGTHYPAYHCNRGHYLRIPKAKFDKTVEAYLKTITLDGVDREEFIKELRKVWRRRRHEVERCGAHVRRNLSKLRELQEAAVDSLMAAENEVVRSKLEERITQIETEILEVTKTTKDREELPEVEFEAFVRWVGELVEHPIRLLSGPGGLAAKELAKGVMFERPPTYDEIANGTPRLSSLFELARLFSMPRSQCVSTLGFGWNTLCPYVARWRRDIRETQSPGSVKPKGCRRGA